MIPIGNAVSPDPTAWSEQATEPSRSGMDLADERCYLPDQDHFTLYKTEPTPETTHDEPDRESLGGFVRARRKANGLTQRELADLAGVGVRFVSELEREKPTLRLDAVDAVLAVFGKRLGVVERPRDEEGERPEEDREVER